VSRVVVIGGGVVGLSCAYYLLRDGHHVTVIDRDGCTKGTSWGNAGMIVPSHFEPMANPPMLQLGFRLAMDTSGPVGFKWSSALLKWAYAFNRTATRRHVHRTQKTILDLNLHSRQCYLDIYGDHVDPRGLIMVCQTPEMVAGERLVQAEAQKLGLKVEEVESDGLADLGFKGAGGIWFKDDAFLTPYDFMPWLRREVERLGGSIVKARAQSLWDTANRPVYSSILPPTGNPVRHVRTDAGDVEGEIFVLAAGAWSGQLCPKLLMTPGRGFGFTVNNPPVKTAASAILVEARVATTPVSDGQRFTGVMELGNYGTEPTTRRLARIRKAIPTYVPSLESHTFDEDVWVGYRPCSYDGVPFIGRFRQTENLIAATGHGMMGMSLGPGTGKLVSQIVACQEPDIDLKWCSPDRRL
jgi:D-amino-acid dehydrogenase